MAPSLSSGYFKKDTTTTAADKMARVLEAEAAATNRQFDKLKKLIYTFIAPIPWYNETTE